MFFRDIYGGDKIGVVWKPECFQASQFKVCYFTSLLSTFFGECFDQKFELDETNTFISRCLAVNIAFLQKLRTRYGTPVMILLLPTDGILIRGSTIIVLWSICPKNRFWLIMYVLWLQHWLTASTKSIPLPQDLRPALTELKKMLHLNSSFHAPWCASGTWKHHLEIVLYYFSE
jgi:hypothetical protein